MMRRIAILALALVALLAIGCGGDDKGSTGTAASTGPTSTEPLTITVWDYSVPDPKAMKAVDDAYEAEHPNVTIKRVHHPFATYVPLLRTAITAGKGPDVFRTVAGPLIQDFERGILPLNDLRTKEDEENLEGWELVTNPNGDILGVPFSGGGTQLYYNKVLFEKAGLDPEAPPKTWDELLTACDKLKAAGIIPISAGWKDGYYAEWWLAQLSPQYQTDEELGKAANDPDWASPALDKAFGLLHDLYERKCFSPNSEATPLFPNTVDEFTAGKGAMFAGLPASTIHWADFRKTKWGKDGLGTFLAPLVPDSLWTEQRMNFVPSNANAITKWTKDPQAVYDYLSYVSSAKSQDTLFESAGVMSNNKQSDPEVSDPVAAQIIEWTKTADPYAGQQQLIRSSVEALFVKLVPAIITGQNTYADVADQVVAEHERAAGK